jgi:hypothetical protein
MLSKEDAVGFATVRSVIESLRYPRAEYAHSPEILEDIAHMESLGGENSPPRQTFRGELLALQRNLSLGAAVPVAVGPADPAPPVVPASVH